jgi:hypothetical protein
MGLMQSCVLAPYILPLMRCAHQRYDVPTDISYPHYVLILLSLCKELTICYLIA